MKILQLLKMMRLIAFFAFCVLGSAIHAQTTYYSINANKADLQLSTSWSDTQDELGANPTDFVSGLGDTFVIDDDGSSISANWSISEIIQVGDGINDVNFIADFAVSNVVTPFVQVFNKGKLSILTTGIFSPQLDVIQSGSLVTYGFNGPQNIPGVTFYDLSISGTGLKTIGGNVNVSNCLFLNSTLSLSNNTVRTLEIQGSITGSGTIRGAISAGANVGNIKFTNSVDISDLRFTSGANYLKSFQYNSPTGSTLTVNSNFGITTSGGLNITNGTVFIANNTLTVSGAVTGGGNLVVNPTGTILYNSLGNQTIISSPVSSYGNLALGGTGIKTLSNVINILNDLTINSGTTLSTSGFNLSVSGNINNNGSFNSGSSTLNLLGGNNQNLSGSSSFTNLTINKPTNGEVNLTAATSVLGMLNIQALAGANKLNTNGNLTLASTATQTASLIDFSTAGSGGSVNGNVKVQRFSLGISATVGHYFSSPVENAPFSVISQTGFNTLLYSENGTPARVFPTFSGSFRRVTTAGSPSNMSVGRGFSTVQPTTKTIQFDGVVNNGNIVVPISYSTDVPASVAGWNFIGNPYPSAIDWGTVTKPTGVTAAYTYNTGGYITIPNAAGNNIGSGQGFFIRTTSSSGTSLTFTNSNRVNGATANNTFYRTEATEKYLYIDLKCNEVGFQKSDAVIFTFSPNATDGYDLMDADKLYNSPPFPNIDTKVDGNNVSLNALSDASFTKTIPLQIYGRTTGSYEISARNLSDFYSNVDVYLIDNLDINNPINLANVASVSFQTATSIVGDRFSISFVDKGTLPLVTIPSEITTTDGFNEQSLLRTFVTDEIQEITSIEVIEKYENNTSENVKIYSYDDKIVVDSEEDINQIKIYDITGSEMKSVSRILKGKSVFHILKEGVYIVRVQTSANIFVKKVIIIQ